MLRGQYRCNEGTFYLRGYDHGDTMVFYLSCPTYKDHNAIDKGFVFSEDDIHPTAWTDLYLSVSGGSVTCSQYVDSYGDSVVCKNSINKDLISRIGGVIRGSVKSCNNLTAVKEKEVYTSASDMVFNPNRITDYSLPNGKVRLCMGKVVIIDYENIEEGISLYLEDDYSYPEQIYKLTNRHYKFPIDLSGFVFTYYSDEDGWDFGDNDILSFDEIVRRNPDKNYSWIAEQDYKVVTTRKEMVSVCKKIWNHDGVVAFDTETTGLRFNFQGGAGGCDRLVGMVFSIEPGQAWYFPVAHKKITNICTPGNEDFIIEKFFKPLLEKKDLLCFNGSFDWKVMYKYGIDCNIVHDLYTLIHVTYWNDHRNIKLGLKPLVSFFLGRDSLELKDFVRGNWGDDDGIKFWDLGLEETKNYACPDTDSLLLFYEFVTKNDFLGKYGARKVYEIEVLFSIVIAYQEYYGHCCNVDKLPDLVAGIQKDKEENYTKMVEIAGEEFNPRSNIELPKLMFEKLGLPTSKKTASGNWSTDKDVRKNILSFKNPDGSDKYPFVRYLSTYLDAAQLESNFTKNIDKMATEDGFMYSEVSQFLETGRTSATKPNYQSYSNVVKKHIIPREGFYAVDTDYASIEYRVLACMAGEDVLVKNFYDPDMDYHTYQASRMFRIPYELVSKQLRGNAKGINFGIPYGMGDKKLGARLFGEVSEENTRKAKKMRKLYFEGQEKVERFFIEARANGVSLSYSDTYFGRRRYFDKSKTRKDSIEREAGNNRIQGTAADIYKMGMGRLFNRIRKEGWLGKFLISAFIHDEGFYEVSKELNPMKIISVLRESLMLNIENWCPLYIGIGFGRNWYEAKNTELPVQLQESLVNTYPTGDWDYWNGSLEGLIKYQYFEIIRHKSGRILDYLKNEENWGKILNPIINSLVHDVLGDLKHGLLDTEIPEEEYKKEVGVVDFGRVKESNDVLENLTNYCSTFGVLDLFEKANIQKPDTTAVKEDIDLDDTLEVDEMDRLEIIQARLDITGVSLDPQNNKKMFVRWFDESTPIGKYSLERVNSIISSKKGDVEVCTLSDGVEYTTNIKTSVMVFSDLISFYRSCNVAKGGN